MVFAVSQCEDANPTPNCDIFDVAQSVDKHEIHLMNV